MVRPTTVALAVVAVIGLAACGGSSGQGASAGSPAAKQGPPAASRAALVGAVQAIYREQAGGDASAAYGQLSVRCRRTISANDYAVAVAQLKPLLKGTRLSRVTITTFAPPLARASYHLVGSDDPRFTKPDQPSAFEHGAWRFDSCAS